MTASIRPATTADAPGICAIHNQGIVDRVATLDTTLRSDEDVVLALAQRGARHPLIVAEVDRVTVGWGSLNQFNARAAYDHVADLSVYVERGWRGQGIGRRLLEQLIEIGRTIGYHKLVLSTLANNEPGIALYTRCGFSRVGIYREMGRLDGQWVDVMIMEKVL